MSISRRNAIQSLFVGASALFTGCSSLSKNGSPEFWKVVRTFNYKGATFTEYLWPVDRPIVFNASSDSSKKVLVPTFDITRINLSDPCSHVMDECIRSSAEAGYPLKYGAIIRIKGRPNLYGIALFPQKMVPCLSFH